MSPDASPRPRAGVALPLSSFQGPIGELIAQRMLSAPSRPGVLATLDRFEILRVLGQGGMGVVLLGRDPDAGSEVAIKLVRPEFVGDPNALRRFVKEAGHLKRLRHPNVVPVLDISERPEGPYFVMPFFENGSLAVRLKPGEPMGRESILDVAVPVAEGLDFAHRRGIIHRDLKPANLLLAADGKVCLADFGLARSLFNDTFVDVENPRWEGTAPYMSPAVAAGEAEDTRCDIYAYGALLYEMLTGCPPYQGERAKEILDQIRAGPPKPILSLNPKADRGLTSIANGALARELRQRYAAMHDILADLQAVRQGRAPTGPHGTGRRIRPMVSLALRSPRLLWVPACLAGVAVLGWMLWRTPWVARQPPVATRPPPASKTENPPRERPQAVAPVTPPVPLPVVTFQVPWGVAVDREDNVFVTDKDKSVVCKITPEGAMTNLAGLADSPGNRDDSGAAARFALPRGVGVDQAGNLFVADGRRLRKVSPWGAVTQFPEHGPGPGGETAFDLPSGVAVDVEGNVFVACRYTIQEVTPAGKIITLAGQDRHAGRVDGAAATAQFSDLEKGIAVDAAANLYVGDMFNHTIRKITPGRGVISWAGTGKAGHADGPGTNASFFKPCGLAVDGAGTVYVADSGNHTIRTITPEGMVRTLAGMAGKPGLANGWATNALFNTPMGVAVDSSNNVYVADTGNRLLRRITPDGQVISIGLPTNALSASRKALDAGPDVALTLPETARRCVELARRGVREDIILAVVRDDRKSHKGPYDLTDPQIFYLEDQGVSENVILELMP
jgi:DNA-binding beta-propeller fold protein YncE